MPGTPAVFSALSSEFLQLQWRQMGTNAAAKPPPFFLAQAPSKRTYTLIMRQYHFAPINIRI